MSAPCKSFSSIVVAIYFIKTKSSTDLETSCIQEILKTLFSTNIQYSYTKTDIFWTCLQYSYLNMKQKILNNKDRA